MGHLHFTVWGGRDKDRAPVDVEVMKVNKKSMWVKLPDGNIIKRKKGRDY